jgi:hypothetical protein
VDTAALSEAAALFHAFGQEYHERMLEEQYVFPEVRRMGGENAPLVEVLIAQHERGREIVGYGQSATRRGRIGTGDGEPLARALEGMARMYEAHATWEDTVIFPAWRLAQPATRFKERASASRNWRSSGSGATASTTASSASVGPLGLGGLATYTAPPPTATRSQ